jgi:transcriptional regulator with XRE-family HTH domain
VIRDLRTETELTQAQLADRAGIGRPHLNQIEAGNRSPTVGVLVPHFPCALLAPRTAAAATLEEYDGTEYGGLPAGTPFSSGESLTFRAALTHRVRRFG